MPPKRKSNKKAPIATGSNTQLAVKRTKPEEVQEVVIQRQVLAQFKDGNGEAVGPSLNLPVEIGVMELHELINQVLNNEEKLPYTFYVDDKEILNNIKTDILTDGSKSSEDILTIVYQPQAVFKVRAVTRCSSTLSGHTEAILVVKFSPDGRSLASGSGDTTVRLWDLATDTPKHTLVGHTNWVLNLEWSPNAKLLASGSMDNTIMVWDPILGKSLGSGLKGHRKWVTSMAWEPCHLNPDTPKLASGSKDGTVRVWDVQMRTTKFTLSGHSSAVTCVKWGGGGDNSKDLIGGVIYTASQDRSIKVWNGATGALIMTLNGHAHWVNSLALSTDYVLRTGPFDHTCQKFDAIENPKQQAKERYESALTDGVERLVSGSDDFTMFLWDPFRQTKPTARLTGHQKLVNHVQFSPDGRNIASGSFDNSVKIWSGTDGKFNQNLRGHVNSVYQVGWSSDSRLVVTSSKDSTLKVWDVRTNKLKVNLPGHLDEVYAVDWSPAGDKVASGGKDRTLKIWRH